MVRDVPIGLRFLDLSQPIRLAHKKRESKKKKILDGTSQDRIRIAVEEEEEERGTLGWKGRREGGGFLILIYDCRSAMSSASTTLLAHTRKQGRRDTSSILPLVVAVWCGGISRLGTDKSAAAAAAAATTTTTRLMMVPKKKLFLHSVASSSELSFLPLSSVCSRRALSQPSI